MREIKIIENGEEIITDLHEVVSVMKIGKDEQLIIHIQSLSNINMKHLRDAVNDFAIGKAKALLLRDKDKITVIKHGD